MCGSAFYGVWFSIVFLSFCAKVEDVIRYKGWPMCVCVSVVVCKVADRCCNGAFRAMACAMVVDECADGSEIVRDVSLDLR